MSIAIHTSNECGHGLIGTSGLHLKVGGFPLQAFVALELISRSHRLHTSFALKHSLGFDIFGLLFPVITCHIVSCHCDYGFRLDSTQQDAASEVWVLIILDVEHDGPAPLPQVTRFKLWFHEDNRTQNPNKTAMLHYTS